MSQVFETTLHTVENDLATAMEQKDQLRDIIVKSKDQFSNYLKDYNPLKGADDVSLLQVYKHFILREKAIYRTLNMFKSCNTLAVGLIWVPAKFEQNLLDAVEEMRSN